MYECWSYPHCTYSYCSDYRFLGCRKIQLTGNQRPKCTEQMVQYRNCLPKRANLIPNLERTVKSYSKFEQETLTKVVEARSKATSVTIDPTNMTEADIAKFQAAQGELSGALSRLMAVVESYLT